MFMGARGIYVHADIEIGLIISGIELFEFEILMYIN